jgi:hypothetical protein
MFFIFIFFLLTLLRKQKQKSKNRLKKKHIEINKETGRDSERIIPRPKDPSEQHVLALRFMSLSCSLSLSQHWLLVRLVLTKFCPLCCPSFSHFLPPIFYWKGNLSFYPKLSKAFITKDSSSCGCCVIVKSPTMLFVCSKRK